MLMRFGDLGWNLGRDFVALDELRREVDRLFAAGQAPPASAPAAQLGGLMRVEIHDDGDAFVLEAEVPGFEKDEIHVSLEEETLTLRGEQRAPSPEGEPRKRARTPARFARAFALPVRVDAEKVTATLRNGILELRLPKAVASKARQIAVNVA